MTDQTTQCPECFQPIHPKQTRCHHCGGGLLPATKTCPKCDSALDRKTARCNECGFEFNADLRWIAVAFVGLVAALAIISLAAFAI